MKKQKRFINDYISFSNILNEYKKVKKACKSENKLFDFSKNLNANIMDIGKKLKNNNYKFSRYNIFLIRENKYRIIMSEKIEDKIVSHFLTTYILLPIIENYLIDQNVATRKNKGTKAALFYFNKYIAALGVNKKIYALKIDINKYFYSINQDKLISMLEKIIIDKSALNLINDIIRLTNSDYVNEKINILKKSEINKINQMNISQKEKINLLKEVDKIPIYEKNKGISIGNITSQLFAVFYLNEVDKYIKNELKCKYYIRYMDDMIILDNDLNKLKKILKKVKNKIEEYDLLVNHKSNIYLVNNSLTFLGRTYFIKNNKLICRVKSKTYKKILRKLKCLRRNDFSKYYLSKSSYKGLIDNDLIDVREEYNFLKRKYEYVFMKENNHYYIDNNKIIEKIFKGKDITVNNFYKFKNYAYKNKVDYILISENKFEKKQS